MDGIIGRLQESAHMTGDHNAAHALHAAVMELRRINADADSLRVMLLKTQQKCETLRSLAAALRDVNASQDRERYECEMIDEMKSQRECVNACMRRMDELNREKEMANMARMDKLNAETKSDGR